MHKKSSPYTFMILSIIDSNFDCPKLINIIHLYAESILIYVLNLIRL